MVLRNTQLSKLTLFLSILLLSACSHSNKNTKEVSSTGNATTPDSMQGLNRKVFSFNKGLDTVFLKPVATAYKTITPKAIDTHIGNFFSNLGDVGNVINNTLQGKFTDATSDAGRIVVNSTIGFAGLVDVASATGMQKHDEDFGQTLAKWGVGSGPYVMLPFLGPSTIRDATAKVSVDRFTDPTHYSDDNIALFITETIKKRADFFAEEEAFKGISDDEYSALRDVWLQNRAFKIRDGKVDTESGTDLIDELEMLDSL